MPRPPGPAAVIAAGLLLVLVAVLGGCAASGHVARQGRRHSGSTLGAPPADSATVLLWDFDETGGARVPDASPHGIEGTAGIDTHTEVGRIHGARTFTRSIESFVWADNRADLDCPGGITVEAWIRLDDVGAYEDTPIAGRWSPIGSEQSWLFSVGGQNLQPPLVSLPSPGQHAGLIPFTQQSGIKGKLMFAFQPREAGVPLSFFSSQPLAIGRWTHVAVTYDGRIVRFYIDSILDAQYAAAGGIRPSNAPLLVGNAFDWRWLTTQTGELRVRDGVDRNPYYALVGALDELRISNVARTAFPYAR